MTNTTKNDAVLAYIARNPGTTQTKVIRAFGHEYFDATPQYGSQRRASRIIANLRERGFLKDVAERCPTCGAARTRGKRNVKLFATNQGISYLGATGVLTKVS